MIPKRIERWTEELQSQFKISIEISDENRDFARWKVQIQDPQNLGEPFYLYFDDTGVATLLEMERFHFGWFNTAEGYEEKDILDVAWHILKGNYDVEQRSLFRHNRVRFQTSRGIIYGKPSTHNVREISSYVKK
jgi:hypothetical protein